MFFLTLCTPTCSTLPKHPSSYANVFYTPLISFLEEGRKLKRQQIKLAPQQLTQLEASFVKSQYLPWLEVDTLVERLGPEKKLHSNLVSKQAQEAKKKKQKDAATNSQVESLPCNTCEWFKRREYRHALESGLSLSICGYERVALPTAAMTRTEDPTIGLEYVLKLLTTIQQQPLDYRTSFELCQSRTARGSTSGDF